MPFRDLAGHRLLLGLLARAVARDSLPPSLIFAGPDGVGKRRTALALAQALNCASPRRRPADGAPDAVEQDGCGECSPCRRIVRGGHADVLLLEPGETGSIKVDQVREAVLRTAYRPFEGRRRVTIVNDADLLGREAQNALLKTLEEPPAASLFVLVTSRPDALLPTVRSRCPRLRFGPLSVSEVAAVLAASHDYPEREARVAAAAADGSAGRALQASGDHADARAVAQQVLEALARAGDARQRLDGAALLAPEKTADRQRVLGRLRALSSLLRDLGVLVARADERLLANTDLAPRLRPLAPSFDSDRVVRAFAAVHRSVEALERNASPKIVAAWLAVRF
jgi:DNA polymerase III subunit delta'